MKVCPRSFSKINGNSLFISYVSLTQFLKEQKKAKMELLEKAKIDNNFGLRKHFPWTSSNCEKPWREDVTNKSEKRFVLSLVNMQMITVYECSTVQKIQNPYLWARYVLRSEEQNADENSPHVSERIVVHATTVSNAHSITQTNFNWRRARRCRFGQGVSFAADATYAKKYASGKTVFIIAGILVGAKTRGSYMTKIPPPFYDTTVDGRGNVYVKYYDDDFYPYYIVY